MQGKAVQGNAKLPMASSSKASQSLEMDGRQMRSGSVLWSGSGLEGPGWLLVGLNCLSWMVM